MSYSTSQFHTGTTTDIQSANATGGARTGLSTDDQTYNLYVSDGVEWRNIRPARLHGLQYTYNNVNIPETPIYHLDASDVNSMKNPEGNTPAHEDTVAEWGSLTCGHKLIQQAVASQPVYRNDNGGSVVFPETEFLQTAIDESQRLSGEFTVMTVRKSWNVAGDLYRVWDGNSGNTSPGGYNSYDTYGSNLRTVCSSSYDMSYDGDRNYDEILVGDYNSGTYSYGAMNGDGTSVRSFHIMTFPRYNQSPSVVGINGENQFDWYNNEFIDKTQIELRTYSERANTYRSVTFWPGTSTQQRRFNTQANRYTVNQSSVINPGRIQRSHLHGLRVGANGLNFSRQSINEIMIFNTCLPVGTLDMLATNAANKWSVSNSLKITQ